MKVSTHLNTLTARASGSCDTTPTSQEDPTPNALGSGWGPYSKADSCGAKGNPISGELSLVL